MSMIIIIIIIIIIINTLTGIATAVSDVVIAVNALSCRVDDLPRSTRKVTHDSSEKSGEPDVGGGEPVGGAAVPVFGNPVNEGRFRARRRQ